MSSVLPHLLKCKDLGKSERGCLRQLAEGSQYRLRGAAFSRTYNNKLLIQWTTYLEPDMPRCLRPEPCGGGVGVQCRDELKWSLPLVAMFESRQEKWREHFNLGSIILNSPAWFVSINDSIRISLPSCSYPTTFILRLVLYLHKLAVFYSRKYPSCDFLKWPIGLGHMLLPHSKAAMSWDVPRVAYIQGFSGYFTS